MSYSHILIPLSQEYPSKKQIVRFMEEVKKLFFGTGGCRVLFTRLTGQRIPIDKAEPQVNPQDLIADRKEICKMEDIPRIIKQARNYNIVMSSEGNPKSKLVVDLKSYEGKFRDITFDYYYSVVLDVRPSAVCLCPDAYDRPCITTRKKKRNLLDFLFRREYCEFEEVEISCCSRNAVFFDQVIMK